MVQMATQSLRLGPCSFYEVNKAKATKTPKITGTIGIIKWHAQNKAKATRTPNITGTMRSTK